MIAWENSKQQREWIAKAVEALKPEVKKGKVDTLIAAGGSGSLFAYPLGVLLEIPVLIASHAGDRYAGRLVNQTEAGDHIVFIDDHFGSGGTFTLCRTVLARHFYEKGKFRVACKYHGLMDVNEHYMPNVIDPKTGFSNKLDYLYVVHATKHIEYTYMYGPSGEAQGCNKLIRCDKNHPRMSNLYGYNDERHVAALVGKVKCPFPDVAEPAKPARRKVAA